MGKATLKEIILKNGQPAITLFGDHTHLHINPSGKFIIGKTQVTIEYLQKEDGSVEPQKIHTVLISTQHAEPSKAVRSKECAGYTGPEMTAPSMEDMNKAIIEDVVKATLKKIILKNGQPAISLFGDHTHLHINPSGKFIIGGPQGDAGLTGRKIIIDTYGGWGAHGGGAF